MIPFDMSFFSRRLLAACVIAMVMVVALAACGSSSSSAPASVVTARSQARLNLAKCLRAHGLNVPDPKPGGGAGGGSGFGKALQSFPPAQVTAARQACATYFAKSSGLLSASPAQLAQFRAQAVKFTECMRSHGSDIPDPTLASLQGGLGGAVIPRSIDQNSPAFKTASTACASLRPKFGKG